MRRSAPILVLLLAATPVLCARAQDTDAPQPTDAARRRAAIIAERLAEGRPVADTDTTDAPETGPASAPADQAVAPAGAQADESLMPRDEAAREGRLLSNRSDRDDSGGDRDDGWVLDTLTALGVVIGLVLLLRWGAQKFGGRVAAKPSRVVEVLSRTSVAPKNHVVLLRVGGRILVVSDSPQGLRTLSEVEDPEEVASLLQSVSADRDDSMTRSFGQLLNGQTRRYDGRASLDDEGGDLGEHHTDQARDSVSRLLGRVRSMSGRGVGE